MAGIRTSSTAASVALGLSLCSMLPAASAAPPAAARVQHGEAHSAPMGSIPQHLDLRPPTGPTMAPRETTLDFTAARDRLSAHLALATARDDRDLPALGAAAGGGRIVSRAESLARNFRREGLPLARLWENRSALVSLGLNGKGKPGLWLVQKTR